ncbi:MAG TPA: hypothetical protein VMK12_29835 [Anaeromyxobacteraceae bacterium]|nr:hypothetical protein [Anaeromyxobacteraceae bacterium]
MQLGTDGSLGSLFLQMTSADARALGRPELDVRWSLANNWSIPTTLVRGGQTVLLQTDEQADSIVASIRAPWSRLLGPGPSFGARPLWERLSTTFEARVIEHWGGWSDGTVEWWHHLIGCFNFDRSLYPRDAVNVTLMDTGTGRGIGIHSSRFAVGDLVARTQFLVAEGGVSKTTPGRSRWGVSTRLDVKVPVGSPSRLGGSGGWDGGLALLGTAELTRWLTVHGMAAVSAFSPLALPEPLQPRTWHYTAELSMAFRAGPVTLLFEDRLDSTLFQAGWQRVPLGGNDGFLSSGYFGAFRPQNQLSGGVRFGPVTFWFSEDWTPGSNPYSSSGWFYNSNTPDIEIGLAYSRSL